MRQNNIAPYMSNDIRDNKPTTTSLNVENVRNEYRGVRYSNQNAYTGGGTGTGSYDFGSVDLTGSGGGGGMDDSLRIDQGIPVTQRNPMLRKNVVSYNDGGRHDNPYIYADGGWTYKSPLTEAWEGYDQSFGGKKGKITGSRNNHQNGTAARVIHRDVKTRYDQGGMMDQQDGNGIYWQNMAARIGQKNAGVAMQQTQNIINGNGKGSPYQMPDQRNMMPNAQFDQGGMLGGNDNSIRGLISGAMQDVNAQMMPAPQKRRFTSGGRF